MKFLTETACLWRGRWSAVRFYLPLPSDISSLNVEEDSTFNQYQWTKDQGIPILVRIKDSVSPLSIGWLNGYSKKMVNDTVIAVARRQITMNLNETSEFS